MPEQLDSNKQKKAPESTMNTEIMEVIHFLEKQRRVTHAPIKAPRDK